MYPCMPYPFDYLCREGEQGWATLQRERTVQVCLCKYRCQFGPTGAMMARASMEVSLPDMLPQRSMAGTIPSCLAIPYFGMGAIDPVIFSTYSDVHLRVWFSDGYRFCEPAPHRPFASVPYALSMQASLRAVLPRVCCLLEQADLNRTITKAMLSQQLLDDLNRTVDKSMLADEVLNDLNATRPLVR